MRERQKRSKAETQEGREIETITYRERRGTYVMEGEEKKKKLKLMEDREREAEGVRLRGNG